MTDIIIHPDARAVIEALGLRPHPEGGYFAETFRSRATIAGVRSASTAIYFLIPAGEFSALHRLASEEVWHFYDGDPLDLHTIDERGAHGVTRLGRDLAAGERPQCVVAAGVWQAAAPQGERFSLCGCTVAPGFEFADFELALREVLTRRYPQLRAAIEILTRA